MLNQRNGRYFPRFHTPLSGFRTSLGIRNDKKQAEMDQLAETEDIFGAVTAVGQRANWQLVDSVLNVLPCMS